MQAKTVQKSKEPKEQLVEEEEEKEEDQCAEHPEVGDQGG